MATDFAKEFHDKKWGSVAACDDSCFALGELRELVEQVRADERASLAPALEPAPEPCDSFTPMEHGPSCCARCRWVKSKHAAPAGGEFMCDDHAYLGPTPCPECEKSDAAAFPVERAARAGDGLDRLRKAAQEVYDNADLDSAPQAFERLRIVLEEVKCSSC